MINRPSPLLRESFEAVADSLGDLVGQPLARVAYAMPTGFAWEHDVSIPAIHEAELAVMLDFGGRITRLDWAQSGPDEGLALQMDSEFPAQWTLREVSNVPAWSRLVGTPLGGVTLVWHQADAQAATTALAAGFRFLNGASVTVALGELAGGRPCYLPDQIVVLFDEDVARRYLGALSTGSSNVGRSA